MASVDQSKTSQAVHPRDQILDAVLPLVPFDGWSKDALENAGVDMAMARQLFPRGGVDLALAFHDRSDAALKTAMQTRDLSDLRYSERVAEAIWMRLQLVAADREAVRRAAAMFALPGYAGDGVKAIFRTVDTIWNGLGDTSQDLNWYTKRMTLSAVYTSVVLFWLGDQSADFADTRAFIDRRIDNVMSFEKNKATFRKSPLGRAFAAGPGKLLAGIQAPGASPDGVPGKFNKS